MSSPKSTGSSPDLQDSLAGNREINSLDVFFRPKSVAVVGATERPGHVGRAILWNLISNPFGGTIYPVNSRGGAVLGVRAYTSVLKVPEPVDLAVIATPAVTVPGVIRECAESGIPGAIIISAGFRETGEAGRNLERQLLDSARRGNIRLIGPNCLGVMCPVTGFNATFAPSIARKGSVALLSQSGAICTALLDWSLREQVGFSALVSVGSMLDIGWGTLIDYLGRDPDTHSIVVYMESVGDARSFLSAAREVALDKPILVIKGGRSDTAAKAAASHTGALAGSDAVLDAAFRRVGVLRINHLEDIFQMTEVLSRQPRPSGNRLAIVTNAGGPGILATDELTSLGEQLAPLAPGTLDALNNVLPPHWSHANPVDLIGDADAHRYRQAVRIVAEDPNTDGVLIIMSPQGLSDPVDIADKLAPFARLGKKPVLASWMGGRKAAEGEAILNNAGIPTFPFPDAAVRAFHYMWRYSYNLRALYQIPESSSDEPEAAAASAKLIAAVRNKGRTLLTESEAKQLLACYGIPVTETRVAATEDEAVEAATVLGFPVVVKLNSFTLTHKAELEGVKLSLENADAVRAAFRDIRVAVTEKAGSQHFAGVSVQPMISRDGYELIVGSATDPQFGPVLLFGAGGRLVDVFRDSSLALPPLNTVLARRFLEQTKIYSALHGVRGRKPVDLGALERMLVRFSELVIENPAIKEIDINPLLASPEGLLALDARVLLHDANLHELPTAAIRPYPRKYSTDVTLNDGTRLRIRPIRPEDEPALVRFHATLSPDSVFKRYFTVLPIESRIRHERLSRLCFIDYDRQIAFIAEHRNAGGSPGEIVGVARLIKSTSGCEGEVAAVVSDAFQHKGIGRKLVHKLIEFACDEGLTALTASVLTENWAMQKLLEAEGFRFRAGSGFGSPEGEMYFELKPPAHTERAI